MITGTEIYWITRLDCVRDLLFIVGGVSFGLSIVGIVVSSIWHLVNIVDSNDGYESNKKMLPTSRTAIKTFILCILLSFPILAIACFVPTTKEACAILIIPKVVNNEKIQELPEQVVDLATEWIEELKPQKDEE